MELGFCFDCKELNYAIANNNGVFEKANMSSNHHNCKNVMIFDKPEKYSPPIKNMLAKLQAGLPVSINEIILFKLAMQLEYDV